MGLKQNQLNIQSIIKKESLKHINSLKQERFSIRKSIKFYQMSN
jgi:hypothetical protein